MLHVKEGGRERALCILFIFLFATTLGWLGVSVRRFDDACRIREKYKDKSL